MDKITENKIKEIIANPPEKKVYTVFDVIKAAEKALHTNYLGQEENEKTGGYDYGQGHFEIRSSYVYSKREKQEIAWVEPDPSNPISKRLVKYYELDDWERADAGDFMELFPEITVY